MSKRNSLDREVRAMSQAYAALKSLDEAEFHRAMEWLRDRYMGDRRKDTVSVYNRKEDVAKMIAPRIGVSCE